MSRATSPRLRSRGGGTARAGGSRVRVREVDSAGRRRQGPSVCWAGASGGQAFAHRDLRPWFLHQTCKTFLAHDHCQQSACLYPPPPSENLYPKEMLNSVEYSFCFRRTIIRSLVSPNTSVHFGALGCPGILLKCNARWIELIFFIK